MAADIGCTVNLTNPTTPLLLEQSTPNVISITSANSHSMRSTSKGHLLFNLPETATKCHHVPKLYAPPLSIGQACDANCTAIFISKKMHLLRNQDIDIQVKNKPIYTRYRASNGLYLVPVSNNTAPHTDFPYLHLCNSTYTQVNTKALTLLLHASLGYPPTKTICSAADKGFLATFPRLHSSVARKHILLSCSLHSRIRPFPDQQLS